MLCFSFLLYFISSASKTVIKATLRLWCGKLPEKTVVSSIDSESIFILNWSSRAVITYLTGTLLNVLSPSIHVGLENWVAEDFDGLPFIFLMRSVGSKICSEDSKVTLTFPS